MKYKRILLKLSGEALMGTQSYGIEPDWSLYRPARYQQPIAKYHITQASPPDVRVIEPHGPVRRHLFIPDEHNDPRHPHRLAVQTWVARYGSEQRHDVVIKAGDSGTFDSVSRHDKDDTLRGRLKPGIKDDLSNHLASLQAIVARKVIRINPSHQCTNT